MRFNVKLGDITKIDSDAIVNAANSSLLDGGGVDQAIHIAAGPELLKECKALGGCETGDAKVTRAYNLPAKYVFHTVGPVWRGGNNNERLSLAECYVNCCRLADSLDCRHITFPSISTGAYGYPLKEAAKIAVETILIYMDNTDTKIKQVDMICFDQTTYDAYHIAYINYCDEIINSLIECCTPKSKLESDEKSYIIERKYQQLVETIAQRTTDWDGLGHYTDYIEMSGKSIDRNANHPEKLDFDTTVATLICVCRELHWCDFSDAIVRRIQDGKLLRLANHLKDAEKHLPNYVLDSIMGLVVADALGVPVEFQDRESLKKHPVHGMREYGTHNQPAGTWSDDSSMVLCTMDSLIQGLDYMDIMDKFKSWLQHASYTPYNNVFDVGVATSKAINQYEQGIDPLCCGGTKEYDNGNGSLMRILPMALYQYVHCKHLTTRKQFSLMEPITNVSKLTHAHKISLIACGIYSEIVWFTLDFRKEKSIFKCIEEGVKDAINYFKYSMEEYGTTLFQYDRLRDLEAFKNLSESKIKSSGYVVDTLEAAIWCLLNTDSYKDCVLKAVNLGDDTDTVAAVAGGIAGLYYGYKSIPDKWLRTIAKRDWIEGMCSKFYQSLWGYELEERL